jgi:hypothetical protein
MSVRRTYFVRMPTVATSGVLDVMVEGPVGSPTVPVSAANAPVGWAGGNGSFFELRSRPLRCPDKALLPNGQPNPAFVPRFRLGWTLAIHDVLAAGTPVPAPPLPRVIFTQSLVGNLLDVILGFAVGADPAYGPVIRLQNEVAVETRVYALYLDVAESKNDDRDPS